MVPEAINHPDRAKDEHHCGWFCFRPICMQRCGKPPCLLVFICAYCIVNNAVIVGVFSPSVSTIEKRFSLSSSQMGMVASIYDFAPLIFVGPISYFGARNRPKWLGCGMLTMGLGYFLFILPHLMIEKYRPAVGLVSHGNITSSSSLLCKSSSGSPLAKCTTSSKDSNLYYAIFLFAMFLAGIGCTPNISLGIPFLDDSVHPRKSPMYVGTFIASGVMAVLVGFAMAYFCLQVFVNPDVAVTLTPKDGEWIGAWWLGFVMGLVLAVIVGICLLAFPNELQNAKEVRKQLEKEKSTEARREEAPTLTLKEMPKSLKKLVIENPPYLFLLMYSGLQAFGVSSNAAFGPKIMAVQFQVSPAKISLIFGIIAISGASIGNFGGAYIQQRFKLGGLGALKFSSIASFITMLLGCYLFIYCDANPVAGITTAYTNSTRSLSNECNRNCSCAQGSFLPVCADALTYATPCLAGCTRRMGARVFSNCTCLPLSNTAILGSCRASCGILPYVYYTSFFVFSCVLFLTTTPVMMAVLRCVPFRLKTFAMGIQSLSIRVLGTIPGPIFLGYLIDNSCVFWNKTCDNKRGSCGLYDNKKMAVSMAITFLIVNVLGTLSMFIAWQLYKRKATSETETTDEEQLNQTDNISNANTERYNSVEDLNTKL